jgi:hypothetical protein
MKMAAKRKKENRGDSKFNDWIAAILGISLVALFATICLILLFAIAWNWPSAQVCVELLRGLLPYMGTALGVVIGFYLRGEVSGHMRRD